jgi:hypothetical protein
MNQSNANDRKTDEEWCVWLRASSERVTAGRHAEDHLRRQRIG